MNSTYDYFMAALQDFLGKGSLKQNEIASLSGIAPQTINAYVHGRKIPGLTKQENIAMACGYTYIEFVLLGKDLLEGTEPGPAVPSKVVYRITIERIEDKEGD